MGSDGTLCPPGISRCRGLDRTVRRLEPEGDRDHPSEEKDAVSMERCSKCQSMRVFCPRRQHRYGISLLFSSDVPDSKLPFDRHDPLLMPGRQREQKKGEEMKLDGPFTRTRAIYGDMFLPYVLSAVGPHTFAESLPRTQALCSKDIRDFLQQRDQPVQFRVASDGFFFCPPLLFVLPPPRTRRVTGFPSSPPACASKILHAPWSRSAVEREIERQKSQGSEDALSHPPFRSIPLTLSVDARPVAHAGSPSRCSRGNSSNWSCACSRADCCSSCCTSCSCLCARTEVVSESKGGKACEKKKGGAGVGDARWKGEMEVLSGTILLIVKKEMGIYQGFDGKLLVQKGEKWKGGKGIRWLEQLTLAALADVATPCAFAASGTTTLSSAGGTCLFVRRRRILRHDDGFQFLQFWIGSVFSKTIGSRRMRMFLSCYEWDKGSTTYILPAARQRDKSIQGKPVGRAQPLSYSPYSNTRLTCTGKPMTYPPIALFSCGQ
nr:hypothetical protein CFP56_08149 [Quercus suber]